MTSVPTSPCRLCGGNAIRVFEATLLGRHRVGYWECTQCACLQTDPPHWLDEANRADSVMLDVGAAQRSITLSLTVPPLLEQLGVGANTSCLDWGGGDGLFTRLMRDRGFAFFLHDDRTGNRYAQGFARTDAATAVFPVTTALKVLEQLPDPARDLDRVFAADSDIVIATAQLYRGEGPDWPQLSPNTGRSVFFYSLRGLDMLAQRYGMRLHSNGQTHVFYREHPRHLRYSPDQVHAMGKALADPAGLLESGLRGLQQHLRQAPHRHVEADAHLLSERLRSTRPAADQAPPPARERLHFQIRRTPAKPRVMIDSVFFQLQRTGIARVWHSLLKEWSGTDFAERLLVLDRNGWAPRVPGIAYRMIEPHDYADPQRQRRLIEQCGLEEKAGVFISTYYTTPLTIPSVMMVYDMIPEMLKMNLAQPMWVEKRAAIDYARRYICISESTRSDLERLHPETAGRTSLAYPGVDSSFRVLPDADRQALLAEVRCPEGFFLLVGGLHEHKNGVALVQALAQMPPEERLPVLCSSRHASPDQLNGLPEGVEVRLVRAEDNALVRLYNAATALVFPSFYEGFGLPLIEAMACGCPVVASDLPVLREVGAEAALYIDPRSPSSIVPALRAVRHPGTRNALIQGGFKRSRRFTWPGMAAAVREVLEQEADRAGA
ncbi:glycosyltransferase (plasmid) [Azospirillum sp. A29]|uniref:glycosyltransferase n=1 Tax=Azospirillum sp. A29 TaxID=3160606 RepID=UPI00366A6EF7